MPKGIYDRKLAWDRGVRDPKGRFNLYIGVDMRVKPDSEQSPNKQNFGEDQECVFI